MSQNFGITEMISQAGYIPGTRDFKISVEGASTTLAEKLSIPDELMVVIIEPGPNSKRHLYCVDARRHATRCSGKLDAYK